MKIETLLKKIKGYPHGDIQLVEKAYKFAEEKYRGMKRRSGQPFIQHPLHIAYILAELKLDVVTIAAALLHNIHIVTDTSKDEIKRKFGNDVLKLVDGVSRISLLKQDNKEEYDAESIRKVIMASLDDIRVIFIKLADKLHNMRTLEYFKKEDRKRIAKQVMDVYAPIAYKLGIGSIKWELEELAFKYLYPKQYSEIRKYLQKGTREREKEVEKIKKVLEEELVKNKISVIKLYGRPKHIYSIYKKMIKKDKKINELYDLIALRIIVKTVKECYEVLGIIHNLWTPIPNEFDDYIATPKSNMYQSLHTAVIGPGGSPLEIQIRTEEMHKTAEEGVAAHWQYKGVCGDQEFDAKLSWMKQVLEWQQEAKDAKEFMEMLHIDFFEDEIFAFTPKGKVIKLPKGATVLDFAYAIHSRVGEQCIGAKINSQFAPIRTLVKNGDSVEIIISKNQHPSRAWLKIAKTSKAVTKIKQYIRKTQEIPVKSIKKMAGEKRELEECIIHVERIKNPQIKIAKCCHPIPGDKIVGFATKTDKVTIHKSECHNIKEISLSGAKKKVKAHWVNNLGSEVELIIDAENRVGLFAEVLNTIVATNTAVKHTKARQTTNGMVECSFLIESRSMRHVQDLIRRISKLKDVKKVSIGLLSGQYNKKAQKVQKK